MVALEKYFVERPDIVMLDLVMKGMYGLDVLTKLRELDPAARVIVVSADVQSSSRDMVQAAGASGFVNKPVDRDHLLTRSSGACLKGRTDGTHGHSAGRAHRAAQHRLRPGGGIVVAADGASRAARSAESHRPSD